MAAVEKLFQRYLINLRGISTRGIPYRKSQCSTALPDEVPDGASKGQPEEPCPGDQRTLRAAILGVPNAGKTTLVNQLLRQKLFAVSPKKHTTTRSAVGVFTQGNSQIILMDTPGVIPYQVGRKLKTPKSFLTGPQRSLMEAELVLVVVDASDKKTRDQLDPHLVRTLNNHSHIPAVLLLNKVDVIRHKHVLLQVTESLTGAAERWAWEERQRKQRNRRRPFDLEAEKVHQAGTQELLQADLLSSPKEAQSSLVEDPQLYQVQEGGSQGAPAVETFQDVFMVSALTGDGIDDLREFLVSCARPGLWEYSVTVQSDQSQVTLVEDIVREKLFLHLHREIPYVVQQNNILWEKEGDTQVIYQNLICRSTSQASIVIGPAGRTVQAITAEAKEDIEALLGCPVELTLNVRTRK